MKDNASRGESSLTREGMYHTLEVEKIAMLHVRSKAYYMELIMWSS